MTKDVPSPIDLRNLSDAKEWQDTANIKRPWRQDFFQFYVEDITQNLPKNAEILELGSGPGFLAKYLLQQLPEISYTAFDFSQAMHQLSQQKLSAQELQRAIYVIGDFKQPHWTKTLGQYDVVIIHQALHELRHKDYAVNFHRQVRILLKPQASYLVCDHLYAENAMQNNALYMSKKEQLQAFQQAGYSQVDILLDINGLCLFKTQIN